MGGGRIPPFDAIQHVDEHGEYWSARELAKLLGYALWQNVESAIERARTACEKASHPITDHFIAINKVMEGGRWGKRTIKDYQLSRDACYLIVQNSDPSKEAVALGQTYFATRTRGRRAWQTGSITILDASRGRG